MDTESAASVIEVISFATQVDIKAAGALSIDESVQAELRDYKSQRGRIDATSELGSTHSSSGSTCRGT